MWRIEGLIFAWDLSLDNSADSYLYFQLALLHSLSYFFFLNQHLLCLYTWFFILFHQMYRRFFSSTHLPMCLSFETLMSIIKTGEAILVELIDLINCYNFSISNDLTWLTFLLGSLTVTLTVLLFWICFFCSDTSICSTMAFLCREILIMLSQFPLTFYQSQNEIPHFIA